MSAKFFEKYSIEEISARTKISPISLRYIKNKEYEKIPRVKFLGFIKIIQREFNEDLSYLINEYDQHNNIKPKPDKKETKPQQEEIKTTKKEKNIIYILATALLLISGGIIYLNLNKPSNQKKQTYTPDNFKITTPKPQEENISKENNITQKVSNNQNLKPSKEENSSLKENNYSQKITTKISIPEKIIIIPNEKIWFKAVNLDNNKTIEYLTSNPKTLNGSNYLIKFGHGNVTIEYGNTTITPNTKKIIRLYFHNGKYEYVKKGFRP